MSNIGSNIGSSMGRSIGSSVGSSIGSNIVSSVVSNTGSSIIFYFLLKYSSIAQPRNFDKYIPSDNLRN